MVELSLKSSFFLGTYKRVGLLHTESIGGLISQGDLILAGGRGPQKSKSILYCYEIDANKWWSNSYKSRLKTMGYETRTLSGFRGKILWKLLRGYEYFSVVRGSRSRHYCGSPAWEGTECLGFRLNPRPWIQIANQEVFDCQSSLDQLGIDLGAPIVAFGFRTADYWSSDPMKGDSWTGGGSSQDFRNIEVQNYLPTLIHLRKLGYQIVRLGRYHRPHPELINIGVSDIWSLESIPDSMESTLLAHSEFAFFGGAFGLNQMALAFQLPILLTDVRPLVGLNFDSPFNLALPSLIWSSKLGRTLTTSEMAVRPFASGKRFHDHGERFIHNTEEDIQSSMNELLVRIRSQDYSRHSAQQLKFWEEWDDSAPNWIEYGISDTTRIRLPRVHKGLMPLIGERRTWIADSFLTSHKGELNL
jgi:putative glycosyltransferase (TIGR04372 family)